MSLTFIPTLFFCSAVQVTLSKLLMHCIEIVRLLVYISFYISHMIYLIYLWLHN